MRSSRTHPVSGPVRRCPLNPRLVCGPTASGDHSAITQTCAVLREIGNEKADRVCDVIGCSKAAAGDATKDSLILRFVDVGSHRRSGSVAIGPQQTAIPPDKPTLANFRTISTALS